MSAEFLLGNLLNVVQAFISSAIEHVSTCLFCRVLYILESVLKGNDKGCMFHHPRQCTVLFLYLQLIQLLL
jgi:hypothetical protein